MDHYHIWDKLIQWVYGEIVWMSRFLKFVHYALWHGKF